MIHWNPTGKHYPRPWYNCSSIQLRTADGQCFRWTQHTLRLHLVLCSIEIKWWSGKRRIH